MGALRFDASCLRPPSSRPLLQSRNLVSHYQRVYTAVNMSQDDIIDLTGENSSPAPLASIGPVNILSTEERSNSTIDLSALPEKSGLRSDTEPLESASPSVWPATVTEPPVSATGSLGDHVPPAEQHAVPMLHPASASTEIDHGSNRHHTATEDAVADEQVLLMLVGLVGAGKVSRLSMFASMCRFPSRDAH